MLVPVRHMIRSHMQASLIIRLGAAVVTFSLVMFWRVSIDQGALQERQRVEAELRQEQAALTLRLKGVEDSAEIEKMRLAAALGQIETNGQDVETIAAAVTPFHMQDVVGSIVELVCIDNVNKDVYYTGSGTVIDPTGLILTNRHILLSEDQSLIGFCGIGFTSNLQDSPVIEFVAASQAAHAESDLAILQITERLDGKEMPDSFAAIEITDNTVRAVDLQLGDSLFIGGYPGIGADTFTFTQGVVSGLVGYNLGKTSALIDSGTSGGAVFDARGRFVGVPTAAVRGEIGGSLGYLISADAVDTFLAEYYEGKHRLGE